MFFSLIFNFICLHIYFEKNIVTITSFPKEILNSWLLRYKSHSLEKEAFLMDFGKIFSNMVLGKLY